MVLTTYPTRTYNHSAGKPHISNHKNDNGVNGCYITPNKQVCSYIMMRTGYIQWDDNDITFLLDQYVLLDFHSAS
jgi:hypothetical protein